MHNIVVLLSLALAVSASAQKADHVNAESSGALKTNQREFAMVVPNRESFNVKSLASDMKQEIEQVEEK